MKTTANLALSPRRTLIVLALLLTPLASLLAQRDTTTPPKPTFYVGAWGGFSFVSTDAFLHPDYFNRKITIPSDAVFTTGTGSGPMFGVLFELPFSENFAVGLRAGYQSRPSTLTMQYQNVTDVRSPDGSIQAATVESTLESDFGNLMVVPHVKIMPASVPIYFFGGPALLYPISATRTLSERVVAPGRSVFRDNNRTTRTLASGDLTTAKLTMGYALGIGYELAFTDRFGIFIEGQYSGVTADIVDGLRSDERWMNSALSAVVGVRLGLGGARPLPPPPPIARDTVASTRDTAFTAGGVTPEGLSDTLTISTRKVQAAEMHALLPYIFFARDSAVIPSRYIQLTSRTRRTFQTEALPRGNTLGVYYQVLNVIGDRMRKTSGSKLVLTGCRSQFETDDTSLSLRRAQAVKDYLTSVWRISPRRIEVVGRDLPANPSLSEVEEAEGARENQRVEIASEPESILGPVSLLDTAFLSPAGVVRFLPPAYNDTSGLETWSLDVMIGDSVIRDAVTGAGEVPREIDFPIASRPDLDFSDPEQVSATFVVRDTLMQAIRQVPSTRVTLQQEGQYEEDRPIVNGNFVDVYNLLLYDFDKDAVQTFSNEAARIMAGRIYPSSVVRVIGHTDRIGLPYYNLALSKRRAETAAELLGVTPKEVSGQGEKKLLYDNEHPEGRYYCRTVTVIIETPADAVKNEQPINGTATAPDSSVPTTTTSPEGE